MALQNLIALLLCLMCRLTLSFNSPQFSGTEDDALGAIIRRAGCQRYLAHGYHYEHMYPIDSVVFDYTDVKRSQGDLKQFEMHISIKAEKDGIILLSPSRDPGSKDLVFEIGVGIGRNAFTVLRLTKDSGDEVARVPTPGILSTEHYTDFKILISDDTLTFGKENEAPIITYKDIRLRTVKYFDVSSWGNIYGKFLYDCPQLPEDVPAIDERSNF